MAGRGGNLNPQGLNQFTARPSGGLVNLRVDFTGINRLAVKVRGESSRADRAILQAHHELAGLLQDYITDALTRAIKAHGRAQRPEQRLLRALRDPRNRRANLQGYTVGYLDQGWSGEVRKYYRGLEVGTNVFVGRVLRGSFQNQQGQLVRPREGGKDPRFLQFGPTGPTRANRSFTTAEGLGGRSRGRARTPRPVLEVRIRNPIVGYHYFKTGWSWFRQDGYLGQNAVDYYALVFDRFGMDFFARLTARGLSGSPGNVRAAASGLRSRPAGSTQ